MVETVKIESQVMDRGSDDLKNTLGDLKELKMVQTRRAWFQECLGCEAKTHFKYFNGDTQIGDSLAESNFFERCCCASCYEFNTDVKSTQGGSMINVTRPFACGAGACKCCCLQKMQVRSGNDQIGEITETYWYCVPRYEIKTPSGDILYAVQPPTCCGGCCYDCFSEGMSCGKACCVVPFRIYQPEQTNCASDQPFIGKILKQPRSMLDELFTDATVLNLTFPEGASPAAKGLIVGTGLLINANHFEGNEE